MRLSKTPQNASMPPEPKTDRCELTAIERAFIAGRRAAGQSFGKISEETGVSKSTVIDTCQKAEEQGTTVPGQKCPRVRLLATRLADHNTSTQRCDRNAAHSAQL